MTKRVKSDIDTKILNAVKQAKIKKISYIAAFRELAPKLNTTASKLQNRWYSFTSKLALATTDTKERKHNTCFLSLSANTVVINRSFFTGVNEIKITKTQYNKILDIIYETQK